MVRDRLPHRVSLFFWFRFYACVIQKTLVGILVKGLPGAIWLLALLTLQMSLSILI